MAASTRVYHYIDENKAQRECKNISIQRLGKLQRETVGRYGGSITATHGSYPHSRNTQSKPPLIRIWQMCFVVSLCLVFPWSDASKLVRFLLLDGLVMLLLAFLNASDVLEVEALP